MRLLVTKMPPTTSTQDFGPTTQQSDGNPSRESLPLGTRLGGYQIVHVLGRSAFSAVYLAIDSSLQRQVAIKEYLPSHLARRRGGPGLAVKPGAEGDYASGLAAFLEEAKVLARFDHPSLARVLRCWEENNTAYTVMPYYEGHTLAAVLKAQPQPPDEAWLRALLTPLLAALGVLHAAQCYHRNISPDNIVLLADGRPVLLDFGAANLVVGDKPQGLASQFDLTYAPIEQASDAAKLPQGPWTDLYALAGVLHFAITGRTPEPASARLGIDPQRPLVESVFGVNLLYPELRYSETFLAGIDQALAVKPRDRPRSVTEFQQLLDRPLLAKAEAARAEPQPEPEPGLVQLLPDDPLPPADARPARDTRREPVMSTRSVQEDWFGARRRNRAAASTRRRVMWGAGLGAVALVAAGASWWWTQNQPVPIPYTLPPSAAMPGGDEPTAAGRPVEGDASGLTPASPAPESPPAASAALPPLRQAVPEPPPAAPPSARKAVPPPVAATPPPRPEPRPAKPVAAAEPASPRAACGSRTNFALVYCLETQCKLPRFARHPQCVDLRRGGEVN